MSRELASPLQVDASGGFAYLTTTQDKASAHVRTILGTELGERLMLPDYGTRTLEHLFEGLTDETVNDLQSDVASALAAWADDITVISIDVAEAESTITVTVTYSIDQAPGSNQSVSLAIPVQTG